MQQPIPREFFFLARMKYSKNSFIGDVDATLLSCRTRNNNKLVNRFQSQFLSEQITSFKFITYFFRFFSLLIQDINECDYPNICPNGCENSIGSYRCLEEDSEVEIIPTNVDVPNTTEFNAPVKACGDGLRLDDSNNCIDIDECAIGNTGCEYCQNTVGGFQCTCPDGFELNNDEKTCRYDGTKLPYSQNRIIFCNHIVWNFPYRDINECTTFSDYEYEDNTPTARSICSHECINTVGSYICRCPINNHLREDKRTCEQDFCKHLNEANKTKCSHDCVDEDDGYHCKCPDGMKLDEDLKTCLGESKPEITLDSCSTSGDRCLPGKCINTEDGSFRCECPTGFAEYNQR